VLLGTKRKVEKWKKKQKTMLTTEKKKKKVFKILGYYRSGSSA